MKNTFVLLSLLISACACQNQPSLTSSAMTDSTDTASLSAKHIKWREGQVVFNEFEGGFYGIRTAEGEKLYPINLAAKYRKAGTIIIFSGEYEKNQQTIQQWGKVFKIDNIQLISTSAVQNNN